MEQVAHYHWKIPSRLSGKDTWQTTEKLTADQALRLNPDAWPVYRSIEMRPGKAGTTMATAVAAGLPTRLGGAAEAAARSGRSAMDWARELATSTRC